MLFFTCRAAHDTDDEKSVVDKIWKKFEINDLYPTGNLFRHDFGIRGAEKQLGYYTNLRDPSNEYTELLDTCQGDCYGFSELLECSFISQGISGKRKIKLFGPNDIMGTSSNEEGGVLIKNWEFLRVSNNEDENYPYTVWFDRRINSLNKLEYKSTGEYWFAKDLKSDVIRKQDALDLLMGHKNPFPPGHFPGHGFVIYNGKWYDPSYGVVFETFHDWEEKAVAGYYKKKIDENSRVHWHARKR